MIADFLHGEFFANIDDKLKRSVSPEINYTFCYTRMCAMCMYKLSIPQVDMFSIQLQSQELTLTAFGFYRFDKELIFSVY